MRVWQIKAPGSVALAELRENITPDTVKIKLTKCMLAASDMQNVRGSESAPYPITPGRLGVGLVSESECEGFKRGQRVAIEPYVACGECAACRVDPRQCGNIRIMGRNCDGLLRDFVVLNKYNLYALPEQVKDGEAIFIDYIAMALKVLDRLELEPGQHIAILGASPIGMVVASLALYYHCVPILIDGQQERLDAARDNGVYYTINSGLSDINKRVLEITGGRMCERSVFCIAGGESPQKAIGLTMHGGKGAYAGFQFQSETCSVNVIDLVIKSMDLIGISDGRGFTARAIHMLANSVVNLKALAAVTVPFDAAGDALLRAAAGNIMAGMLINVEI